MSKKASLISKHFISSPGLKAQVSFSDRLFFVRLYVSFSHFLNARTIRPISTKLCTKHPLVKGTRSFTNKDHFFKKRRCFYSSFPIPIRRKILSNQSIQNRYGICFYPINQSIPNRYWKCIVIISISVKHFSISAIHLIFMLIFRSRWYV